MSFSIDDSLTCLKVRADKEENCHIRDTNIKFFAIFASIGQSIYE